jgi:hypothetical protein
METEPNLYEMATAHFGRVLLLAKRLREARVDIHRHEYDPHFCGMWKIIAGSNRHRFLFIWDGRNQVLTIQESFFSPLGSWEGDWKELRKVSNDVRNGADPFKCVEGFFFSGQ